MRSAPHSDRQQPREERAVPLKRQAKILRRDVAVAVPLCLEPPAFIVETLAQSLDRVGDQVVRLFYRTPRLVYEAGLNIVPTRPEVPNDVGFEQGGVARRPGHIDRPPTITRAFHFAILRQ